MLRCTIQNVWLRQHREMGFLMAVPWLRRLVAGLPLRRPGFDPGSVHVRFVVDKVALGQVFLRVVGLPLSVSFHWCYIFFCVVKGPAADATDAPQP
jgi:hypothetical protein